MRHILTRTAFLCVVALLFSTAANACPNGPRGKIDKMQEKLKLSDDQVAEIKAIFNSVECDCHDLQSREERRECMQEKREEVRSKIESVLTEEQLGKFLARHGRGEDVVFIFEKTTGRL